MADERELEELRRQLESARSMLESEVTEGEESRETSSGVDDWYSYLFGGAGETPAPSEEPEKPKVTKGRKKPSVEELQSEIERLKGYLQMRQLTETVERAVSEFFMANPQLKSLEDLIRTKASVKLTALESQNPQAATQPAELARLVKQALDEASKEVLDTLRNAGINVAAGRGAAASQLVSVPPSGAVTEEVAAPPAEEEVGSPVLQTPTYEVRLVADSDLERMRRRAAEQYVKDRIALLEKQKRGPQIFRELEKSKPAE